MTNNPIVDEVHRIRQEILARFNDDLGAYVQYLQRRTEEAARAGRTVRNVPPHQPKHPSDPAARKAG